MKSKIIERLKQYIDNNGISLNSFDKSIGASNGYTGKQIKNGGSIGCDMLEKIAYTYTDLNLIWLITGKGEMVASYSIMDNEKSMYVVNEPQPTYGKKRIECERCKHLEEIMAEKEKHILALNEIINAKNQLIENITGDAGKRVTA